MDFILNGTLFSYYSAKARAALSYKRVPFVERYDLDHMKRDLAPVVGRVIIPIVECPDGRVLQDSTEIIDVLEAEFPGRPLFPADGVQMLLSRIVEFVADELWITTGMNTRWNDPLSKAFVIEEFTQGLGGNLGQDRARAVGEGTAAKMQSYLPMLGIDSASGQAAASAWFEAGVLALNNVVGPRRFALGAHPSLMDVCLYTALYAHHYRDAGAAQQFMKSRAQGVCHLLDCMHAAHAQSSDGELAIGPELVAFLEVFASPGGSLAHQMIDAAAGLAAEPTGAVVEQPLGSFDVQAAGHTIRRAASTFTWWKAQRVRDCWEALSADEQAGARELVGRIGWLDFLNAQAPARLVRNNYQLYMA